MCYLIFSLTSLQIITVSDWYFWVLPTWCRSKWISGCGEFKCGLALAEVWTLLSGNLVSAAIAKYKDVFVLCLFSRAKHFGFEIKRLHYNVLRVDGVYIHTGWAVKDVELFLGQRKPEWMQEAPKTRRKGKGLWFSPDRALIQTSKLCLIVLLPSVYRNGPSSNSKYKYWAS